MVRFRIILGAIVGSLLSSGLAIGLIYGGVQVSWWLAIILCVIGLIIGGFAGGFIAQDKFPGTIVGFITGLIAFVGIFLFLWLILRAKMLVWYSQNSDINSIASQFIGFLGMDSSSTIGQYITDLITTKYADYGSDIDQFVQKYVPIFTLVVGAILGGGALILGTISGRIGGALNKLDELSGN